VVDRSAIRAAVVAGLAEANGVSSTDAESAITASGGDNRLELDSKTAEWIIAHVELVLGATLPTPADLGREQIATVGALTTAIADALRVATRRG
jgi:acyl carrier protein